MQFMITFNHIDGVWEGLSEADRERHNAWLRSFVAELRKEKGAELVLMSPPEQRKTVRKGSDGELRVEDGPAVASNEQVGGYYIIEADSWDDAVEWGRKGRWLEGSNEVRQIFSLPS